MVVFYTSVQAFDPGWVNHQTFAFLTLSLQHSFLTAEKKYVFNAKKNQKNVKIMRNSLILYFTDLFLFFCPFMY